MKRYGLREGLSFCRIGKHHIFLDIPNDRYFGLNSELEERFAAFVEQGETDEPTLLALSAAGVLIPGGTNPIVACRRSPASPNVLRRPHPPHARRAVWTVKAKRRSLSCNLSELERRRGSMTPATRSEDALEQIALAHSRSALVWSTSGRCLASGMALLSDLIAHRIHARLLFGVQLGPFGAHCWVEVDGTPVCQTSETVESFVPVMIL